MLLLEQHGAWDIGRDDDLRTLEDVARLACRVAGAPEALIEMVDPPPGPAPVLERLEVEPLQTLGWRPQVSLEDGLRATWEWTTQPR